MSSENTKKVLSTLYQREKEIAGVYSLLKNFSLLPGEAREVLIKAEQDDKRHASFLRERLRQLGVEVQKLKEESEKTVEELEEALKGIEEEEKKLDLLMKVLVKIKKDEIARFQSYLELKERDELSQQLLERISNGETHHLLRLEVLDLVKEKTPGAEAKEEVSGDPLS